MNVLVTGGAGFIGSNFVKYMLNKHPDYTVINYDKLTYASNATSDKKYSNNLLDIKDEKRHIFIKGDICDQDLVFKTFEKYKPRFALNFAAETHVDRSIKNPLSFIDTDVKGTGILLEAARKFDVNRFIQISTDEVYGQIMEGSFKETSLLMPRNPYSASKAGGDRLAYSFFATYGLPVVITRSSNTYGPFQFPEKVIPLFVTNLLTNEKVPLYGEGLQVRDWLYVLDNCEAIDLCLHKGKNGEVYNIGGGYELKNIELTKTILKELGKDETFIKKVSDRPGHDFRYSLDCTKIKKEIGWTPKKDFKQGLRETILWYKNNGWWWKKLKH